MRIIIEPYNAEWPIRFTAIKQDLEKILQSGKIPYKSIEHVGSTSIPGMPAKPNIDIDIVVSEDQVRPALSALEQSGLYQSLGELGFPGRWAVHFTSRPSGSALPDHNTYVCVDGCQALRNHLAVRDVCRSNSRLHAEYARTKLELAERDWDDVSGYYVEKSAVLGRILTEAGMGDEVEAIHALNLASRKGVADANRAIKLDISNTQKYE